MNKPICLYVDNSNIFHAGQDYAEKAGEDRYAFRIHFENFVNLATENNPPNEVIWGGSVPPPTDAVWVTLKTQAINPILIPRSDSGENETVDHSIQLNMYRYAKKYRSTPGTIVLCTGDGKGYYNEEGFLFDVEGFVADGWKIKVLSWTHSCHRKLKEFAEQQGSFIPLENYYNSITFIEKIRRVERLPKFHL